MASHKSNALYCVCITIMSSCYGHDQLTGKDADMEKVLLSCDITTKVVVTRFIQDYC